MGAVKGRIAGALAGWLALGTAGCGADEKPGPAKPLAQQDAQAAADATAPDTAPLDSAPLDTAESAGLDSAAEGDAAIGQVPGTLQPPISAEGFLPGGLLARQIAVPASVAHPLDLAVEPTATGAVAAWLQTGGDLAEGEALWTTHWQEPGPGQRRLLVLEGALQLPWNASDPLYLAVSQVGSVRVELAGQVAFEQRNAAELVTWQAPLLPQGPLGGPQPRWVALRVSYAPYGLRQHLQLWWAQKPPKWQALGPAQLGVAQAPIAPLEVQHQLGEANYSAVPLAVQLSVPAAVGVKRGDQWALPLDPSQARDRHELKIPLQNPSSAAHTLVVQDLWGRTFSVSLGVITAKPLPPLEKGGLFAVFHKGTKLAEPVASRVDVGVNFVNDSAAFGAWVQPDQFSVRWSGGLRIDQPGTYALYFSSDDGQRLWLDGEVVAELWSDHGLSEVGAVRTLSAGWHALQLEMYEGSGACAAVLEWQSPGKPRAVVPPEVLGHQILAKPSAAPQIVASEVVRASGAVRLRLRAAGLGMLSVTRKPSGGPATTENWPGPADSWDRVLADWGPGGGQVEVVFTDLAGQVAPPQNLSVPPGP